jgi:hypothetical protein
MINLTSATASIEPHTARGGISVHLPDGQNSISPIWRLGNFEFQFVHLLPGTQFALNDLPTYVKVITGKIDCAPYHAFPEARQVVTTRVKQSQIGVIEAAVLFILRESDKTDTIEHMDQLTVSGPLSELMRWQSFHEKFSVVTDAFQGLDAHMIPGFHLLDTAGQEIAYVHFWTTGKGVDVSTHNHGQDPTDQSPAFAEVHLVLANGTGAGAMYLCDGPGAPQRQRIPIQLGEEHGPFFNVNRTTGLPERNPNGAVDYPWHGWQGGEDNLPGQSYDLVAAFEINPDLAQVTL